MQANQINLELFRVLSTMEILPPTHICTETYLLAGWSDSQEEAEKRNCFLLPGAILFIGYRKCNYRKQKSQKEKNHPLSASHFPKQGLHSFLPWFPSLLQVHLLSPLKLSIWHLLRPQADFNSSPSICTLHAVTSMPFFSKIPEYFSQAAPPHLFQKAFLKIFQIKSEPLFSSCW